MATNKYTVFGGEILAENRAGTKRDYVPDLLGSTRVLLDSSQSQTDTFDYWPYGEEQNHVGASDTPFTFVGSLGYYSGDAGGTYVRTRWYSSTIGNWGTVDWLWPDERSYKYSNSSPISVIDALGLAGCMPKPYDEDPKPTPLIDRFNCESCLQKECGKHIANPEKYAECVWNAILSKKCKKCGYPKPFGNPANCAVECRKECEGDKIGSAKCLNCIANCLLGDVIPVDFGGPKPRSEFPFPGTVRNDGLGGGVEITNGGRGHGRGFGGFKDSGFEITGNTDGDFTFGYGRGKYKCKIIFENGFRFKRCEISLIGFPIR